MTIALIPDKHSRPCIAIQDASGEWMLIWISRLTDRPLELLDRLRRLRETRGDVPIGGTVLSTFAVRRGTAFLAAATVATVLVAAVPLLNGGVLRSAAWWGSLRVAQTALAQMIARARTRANTRERPSLTTMLADLDLLLVVALEAQRAYTDRHGEEHVYPQPDLRSAKDILRLQAELCGFLSKLDAEQVAAILKAANFTITRGPRAA